MDLKERIETIIEGLMRSHPLYILVVVHQQYFQEMYSMIY